MKKHLSTRLFLYFSLALFAFALIVGGFFHLIFLQHFRTHQAEELRHHAESMAEVVESHSRAVLLCATNDEDAASQFSPGHHGMWRHKGMMQERQQEHMYCRRTFQDDISGNTSQESASMGQYLKELNTLAHGEVWLVDAKSRSLSLYGTETSTGYNKLPDKADALLEQVFQGETILSEEFSPLLSAPSATIGVPLHDGTGNVVGALLLHRTLEELHAAQKASLKLLLLSLAAALMISLLLARLLSRRFLRPLQHMERLAAELTRGNYKARSDICQEDEIGSLAQSLDTLASRLEDAKEQRTRMIRMRQDFITNISHELRTPITVLRGTLELINSGLVTDKAKLGDYMGQMMSNVLGLQRLVNDLFELSRLRNADFAMTKSPLNLGDALEDALQAASQLATVKNVTLQIQEQPFVLPMEGDYDRLRQMFLTVLDNAVKFSPEGSSIEILCRNEKSNWCISIRDHGPGIPRDDLPYIFGRFHSKKTESNPNGTGLGLPIAWEIARRHDIRIHCNNMGDGGACFRFSGGTA